jgi:hypothetical protein
VAPHGCRTEGRGPPPAVAISSILDTGSQYTVVDAGVLRGLGLTPVSLRKIRHPGRPGEVEEPVFVAGLTLTRQDLPGNTIEPGCGWGIGDRLVMGVDLAGEADAPAIIGRDVLDDMLIVYHGPRRRVILSH